MKRNNLKLLCMAFCLFFSMSAWAAEITTTINGIGYTLDVVNRTAAVRSTSGGAVVVPETIEYQSVTYTVTSIKKVDRFSITSIKTGNTITKIEAEAFNWCEKLQRVDFGNALQSIGNYAFEDCENLSYIVLPESISSIGATRAFYNCNAVIICLREGFNTHYTSQTIYPSSFFTFGQSVFDYNGQVPPEVSYSFNGIGFGFQPTAANMDPMVATAGTHTTNLVCTFANSFMSFNVDIPCTYTIKPVTLTATVKDASRLYGDADPQFESTYTGFVNNEDASVITSQGSYTTTATATSDVGTYAIKQSGATAQNYVFAYTDGTLTVNKAPLTMTANDKTMSYGSNVPTLDAAYTGLKNNETQPQWVTAPEFATTASSTSKVGTYPITISNAEPKNYTLTVNNGNLTIEKAALTVTAENKSRLYGDADPEFTLAYTGLKNGETVPEWEMNPSIETTATVQSAVGTYPISISNAVAVNYEITPVEGTLTVNKAPLTIKPKDAARLYGEANPAFELLYTGLKNNENTPEWVAEPVITTVATTASSAGEYAISVQSAEAKNYTLTKQNGTLTINKAPLTVSIVNCSRLYGKPNPNFEMSYVGLVNDETEPAWTEQPTIQTVATAESAVGDYAITGTGGILKNYTIDGITPGVLTITPAALVIKAKNASRLYYESEPEFTYECEGLTSFDSDEVLTTKPTLHTTATLESSVGTYPIEIDGAVATNYTISYEKGQLTINKRQLTVSTNDYTRAYAEENPEFVLSYTGFVNNEDENVLMTKPKATTEATADSDTGVYDITIANGVAENYDFEYVGGKLTIEKAYQTLTWNQDLSNVIQYSQVELTAEASSGLDITYTVEGADICSIVQVGNKQYLDCFGLGEAVIVAKQEGNNNYWETTKIYKTVVITSADGINMMMLESDDSVKIYDMSGNRIERLQRGINIIKMSDGTTRKVVIK